MQYIFQKNNKNLHNAIDKKKIKCYNKIKIAQCKYKGGVIMINSNKIKGRLRELNLTQKDAAEALGIAQSTMAQKLNGTRPMTIYEAEALAELLEIEDMQYGVYFFNRKIA